MVVLVLTAVPPGLRGHITRWLFEIAPGVYVGRPSARVREQLWSRVIEFADTGRAIMVYTARNEQRLAFKVHEHDWTPVDLDGVRLIRRPVAVYERAAPTQQVVAQPSAEVQRRRHQRMKFKPRKPD